MPSKFQKKIDALNIKKAVFFKDMQQRKHALQIEEKQIKESLLTLLINDVKTCLTSTDTLSLDHDAFLAGICFVLHELQNKDSKIPASWKAAFANDLQRFQRTKAQSQSKKNASQTATKHNSKTQSSLTP